MVLVDIDREGYEEAVKGMYFSFSITPPEFGLVHERRDINRGLEGKEMLVEALKHVLEKNPDLDSIHIRVGDASLEKE